MKPYFARISCNSSLMYSGEHIHPEEIPIFSACNTIEYAATATPCSSFILRFFDSVSDSLYSVSELLNIKTAAEASAIDLSFDPVPPAFVLLKSLSDRLANCLFLPSSAALAISFLQSLFNIATK
jgi:hypothetical protein